MNSILMVATALGFVASPVADAARFFLESDGANLVAAAQEMPAEKYAFQPTPQQMTFAHLMWHIATSNRIMCSSIGGLPQPPQSSVTDTDGKDALVAEVKASFDYCRGVLAKVDDSALGDELPVFHRTRANVMMFLVADLADHYAMAAIYLRLNGLLPPTATKHAQ